MNISRYYHTLKYLKSRQIAFRGFYFLRRLFRNVLGWKIILEKQPSRSFALQLSPSLPAQVKWLPETNTFHFLNLSHTFSDEIDWHFPQFGKLWTYNLHYFEYLLDASVSKEAGIRLIHDFIRQLPNIPEALEPYPTALRIIFWSRFVSEHNIQDTVLDASMYAQSYLLADHIEYHLLGNHYLENGFGLLFAAYRFGDTYLYEKAKKIIINELEEQILPDGGHFERSPMYHQIILYRLLDCLNLLSNQPKTFPDNWGELLRQKASLMLGWMQQMTFPNGDIALFNDAALGIAPPTAELVNYGRRLGLEAILIPLQQSGYRRLDGISYQILADVGDIGPDYIPGHAHSDTLGFELYLHGQPFLVDTGISTYEKNERRQHERSTAAHNTVQIDQQEQTQVWGGFRVAQRARPVLLQDDPAILKASHTGYDHLNIRHIRTFQAHPNAIIIMDEIKPIDAKKPLKYESTCAFLHFHPSVVVTAKGSNMLLTSSAVIQIKGCLSCEIMDYLYAPGFNQLVKAQKAEIRFERALQVEISVL